VGWCLILPRIRILINEKFLIRAYKNEYEKF
jgi:hypothetical protein